MDILFITGYWNSGTTLLVDIMRKHPQLQLRKSRFKSNIEDRTIKRLLNNLGYDFIKLGDYSEIIKNGFDNYAEAFLTEEDKQRFLKVFDKKFRVQKDKTLLLKNPWLFFMPNFINSTFDNYKVKKINIIRNGWSQVVSKDYWLKNTKDPEQKLYARSKFWVRSMEFFFNNWYNDDNTLNLRYENLCTDPERWIKIVCEFCEIDFDSIHSFIPKALTNRESKWNQLNEDYKKEVLNILQPMQDKIDEFLPKE